jgi:hypothetical protein
MEGTFTLTEGTFTFRFVKGTFTFRFLKVNVPSVKVNVPF